MRKFCILFYCCLILSVAEGQAENHHFKIRTITAGITLNSLQDTSAVSEALKFLNEARKLYTEQGYEVQTIRISTQNLYEIQQGMTLNECLPHLIKLDQMAQKENCMLAIGGLLPPDEYSSMIASWATRFIQETVNTSFSLAISSHNFGIHHNSIKVAAEIIEAIANNSPGGEGNFRFTASANIPPGTPFFPAAYHSGPKSFAIGLEYPNLLTKVFKESDKDHLKRDLKRTLEEMFLPIQQQGISIAKTSGWVYDGIDTSPAPGLDASIGKAIETLTGHPFGGPSTLSACSLITDVINSLDLKTCGYSGLMLPVIEDKVLAIRADEGRYSVQELLLFSSVSGTGLDVVPLPGNTSRGLIERVLEDVASLSVKYTHKALSARLFLIPGKLAGETVSFDNPFLTSAKVMAVE